MSKHIQFGEPIEPEAVVENLPSTHLLAWEPGGLHKATFQVYIVQDIYDEIWAHINQTPNLESGGVLAGYPFITPDNQITFVIITGAIPQHSNNRSVGHFTVGPTEINTARVEMERLYPGLLPVGWYHSHPGHGIFLSNQDMTIVRSIYNISWNLAMVMDPLNRLEGIFVGPKGTPLGDHNNSGLKQNWIGLINTPDCIDAIALYNQIQDALNNQQFSTAHKLLVQLQSFVQNSQQLKHWHEGYRDTDEVEKQLEYNLAKDTQSSLPQPLSSRSISQQITSHREVNQSNSHLSADDWWLRGAGISTSLVAISYIISILFPHIIDSLYLLGSILLSLLTIIITGYIVLSQDITPETPEGSQQYRKPIYSQTERILALIAILFVVLTWVLMYLPRILKIPR